jgi:hypothetical protein
MDPLKKSMNILQKARKEAKQIGICKEGEKGKWVQMSMAVDSGACDNVIHPDELPDYKDSIQETQASRDGDDYVSASGDPIANYGEVRIPMVTREATARGMTFQAAAVAKPLASVKRMTQTNHMVVFDDEMSYVLNKLTGEVNILREEAGNYMLDVWVPPPETAKASGFQRQP